MQKLTAKQVDKVWGYELWLTDIKSAKVLIKVIKTKDALSVQVHPDDAVAQRLEGPSGCGKMECWYVLDAEKDACLVYGLSHACSKDELKKALTSEKIYDYLNKVKVQKGDFLPIEAGVVHTLGGGVTVLEVQQPSDITYRLYDYGRGREIHVEKGFQSIDLGATAATLSVKQFGNEKYECPFFAVEKISIKGGYSSLTSSGSPVYYFGLEGNLMARAVAKDGSSSSVPIAPQEIIATFDGEKITIEGTGAVMKIV